MPPFLDYKPLTELYIRVLLAGHTVAMVTYRVMEMITINLLTNHQAVFLMPLL